MARKRYQSPATKLGRGVAAAGRVGPVQRNVGRAYGGAGAGAERERVGTLAFAAGAPGEIEKQSTEPPRDGVVFVNKPASF